MVQENRNSAHVCMIIDWLRSELSVCGGAESFSKERMIVFLFYYVKLTLTWFLEIEKKNIEKQKQNSKTFTLR